MFDLRKKNTSPLPHAHSVLLWVKRYRSHSAKLQAKSAVIEKLT
jgi:hypothetical protein